MADYIEKSAPYGDEHLPLMHVFNDAGNLLIAGTPADPADGVILASRHQY